MSGAQRDNFPVHCSAGAYDRFTQGFLGRFDRLLVDRLVQELRSKTGRRLLDVGCGTSRFLIRLAGLAAALLEIRRVLAPDGVALIHEVRRDSDPAALAAFNRLRSQAGIESSRRDEKFTVAEIRHFVTVAGLEKEAQIFAPTMGYASLGCEIRLGALR
jgi:ubiquinone/menaquinone biosynthesis C-methylase UbiE